MNWKTVCNVFQRMSDAKISMAEAVALEAGFSPADLLDDAKYDEIRLVTVPLLKKMNTVLDEGEKNAP